MRVTKKPSLAETHPELAAQANGWDPKTFSPVSGKKLAWKCVSGHKWEASIANRSRNKTGCPVCVNKKILVGYNDLATTHPELAKEADGWDPTTVTFGSHAKVDWTCQIGHRWRATVKARSRGSGCRICTNQQILVGYNDLATTHPELAKEADGWDPMTVTFGTDKKVGWNCKLGHKWQAAVSSRSQGVGCSICAGKKVQCGFNDLASTNPELAAQANGWDPTTVTFSSAKKVRWKCTLGHEWDARIDNRKNGKGCPICANQDLLVGYNDLATTHPELAKEADGWDPTTVISGSGTKKYSWKCKLGHRWQATANKRTQGRGCPTCAQTGFDPNQPGFLYFIDHFDLQMFQIGITNFPDDRLGRHKRADWEVIELRGPMDGHLTQRLETSCLHALEKRGAILGHKAGIDSFDGYSEAWTKKSLNVTSIKQILDWVYEDEARK